MDLSKIFKRQSTSGASSAHQEIKFFRTPFIAGKLELPRKDVIGYIQGAAIPKFGDDFFYSEHYEDGIVSYVACSSQHWDVDKTHLFMPGILDPGKWFHHDGGIWYFIDSTELPMKLEIDYAPRDGYRSIEDALPTITVPKLKWSLAKRTFYFNALVAAGFCVAVIIFGLNLKERQSSVQTLKAIPQNTIALVNTCNALPQFLQKLATTLQNGVVEKVEIMNGKPTARIAFDQEYDAQQWLTTHGGRYENGKVVYSADSVGSN